MGRVNGWSVEDLNGHLKARLGSLIEGADNFGIHQRVHFGNNVPPVALLADRAVE